MHPQIKAPPEAHGIFFHMGRKPISSSKPLQENWRGLEEEEKRKAPKLCAIYS
jgi:hypothetical protein